LINPESFVAFWHMTQHSLVGGYLYSLTFYPKGTAVMVLWNTGNHMPEPTLFYQIPGCLPYNA